MLRRRNFLRSWNAKSYEGHTRRNPLFPVAEHRPHAWKKWLLIAGSIMGGLVVIILVTYLPFLSIKEFRVEGLTTLSPEVVKQVAEEQSRRKKFLFLPQTNAWLFDTQRLSSTLEETYHFATLTVTQEGRVMHIVAQERLSEIALMSGDVTWFVSLDGHAIREATPEEQAVIVARSKGEPVAEGENVPVLQPTMPIVRDDSAQEHLPGDAVIAPDRLATLLSLNAGLREQNITPKLFHLYALTDPWMTVKSDKPYDLLFDLNTPASEQLRTLSIILSRYLTPDAAPQYIDLRFGSSVYIK